MYPGTFTETFLSRIFCPVAVAYVVFVFSILQCDHIRAPNLVRTAPCVSYLPKHCYPEALRGLPTRNNISCCFHTWLWTPYFHYMFPCCQCTGLQFCLLNILALRVGTQSFQLPTVGFCHRNALSIQFFLQSQKHYLNECMLFRKDYLSCQGAM